MTQAHQQAAQAQAHAHAQPSDLWLNPNQNLGHLMVPHGTTSNVQENVNYDSDPPPSVGNTPPLSRFKPSQQQSLSGQVRGHQVLGNISNVTPHQEIHDMDVDEERTLTAPPSEQRF